MSDTLDSTFAKYFGDDEPGKKECTRCHTTEQLQVFYTSEFGKTTWICSPCNKEEQARQARSEREQADMVARHAYMSRWEEQ